MASQIGRAGDDGIPIQTNDADQLQEIKPAEVEAKPVEVENNLQKTEVPLRATEREASVLKAELGIGGNLQQAKLNSQLDAKAGAEKAEQPNVIYGTTGNDTVHISKAPGLLGALGMYEVNINGKKQYMTKEQLEHTQFNLGAGNDTLVVDSNVNVGIHADGGAGDDVLIGGGGNDVLNGGSGNDIIAGRGGNDVISGGRGNDVLLGGANDDRIDGGPGNDYIDGGTGKDQISGGTGKDSIKLDLRDYLKTGIKPEDKK
jgi:Ca2+-binding RTX toxin-like protein